MNNKKISNIPEVTQEQFTEIVTVIKNLIPRHPDN